MSSHQQNPNHQQNAMNSNDGNDKQWRNKKHTPSRKDYLPGEYVPFRDLLSMKDELLALKQETVRKQKEERKRKEQEDLKKELIESLSALLQPITTTSSSNAVYSSTTPFGSSLETLRNENLPPPPSFEHISRAHPGLTINLDDASAKLILDSISQLRSAVEHQQKQSQEFNSALRTQLSEVTKEVNKLKSQSRVSIAQPVATPLISRLDSAKSPKLKNSTKRKRLSSSSEEDSHEPEDGNSSEEDEDIINLRIADIEAIVGKGKKWKKQARIYCENNGLEYKSYESKTAFLLRAAKQSLKQ
jgi:hypothetical protein